MSYDVNKLARLKHLKEAALKTKETTDALGVRIKALEDVGAQANVIESIKVNGTAQAISSKSVNITVPTKVGDLTNDQKFQTETQVSTAISKAVAAADHLKRKVVNSTADIDLRLLTHPSISIWSPRALPVRLTSTTSTWLLTAFWRRWVTGALT